MPVPALIAAGASLIGGAMGAAGQASANRTNLRIAQEQNRLNYQMFREQNQFNLDQWNRQNEYNSPLAQRKRYEEAGINPFMAMGNIQPGQAESLTSANAQGAQGATMQNAMAPLSEGLMNASQLVSQNLLAQEQLKINKDIAKAQILNIDADTLSKDLNNRNYQRLVESEIGLRNSQARKAEADYELAKVNAESARELLPDQKLKLRSEIQKLVTDTRAVEIANETAIWELKHLKPAQLKAIYSDIALNSQCSIYYAAQANLSRAQTELVAEQVLTESFKRQGIHLDNRMKAKILPHYQKRYVTETEHLKSQIGKNNADARYANARADTHKLEVSLRAIATSGDLIKDLASAYGSAKSGMSINLGSNPNSYQSEAGRQMRQFYGGR